jgi:hypothetical protein
MIGIARDLGGIPALSATAKYQLIASFVILLIAGPPRADAAGETVKSYFFCSSRG